MAAEPLLRALSRMRAHLLDDQVLVRAVASGRQRGQEARWKRVELRYVDLKAGRHLQVTAYDETQAHTSNHAVGDEARDAVDDLLDQPFANWHVETTTEQHQVRVTKKLEAMVHTSAREAEVEVERGHDKPKSRLLPEDDPVLMALGISDQQGRIKPSRQAKYRQVEEFLRLLDSSITDALEAGALRTADRRGPAADRRPRLRQRLPDLRRAPLPHPRAGAAGHRHRAWTSRSSPATTTAGWPPRSASRTPPTSWSAPSAPLSLAQAPEVVLALHACDTATDEALARAVEWESPLVLAAPCCHHDIAAQLRRNPTPAPYALLTRHGILRERFADTLTDALRAALLRVLGYRVDVVEFVESQHTPRNTLLRAVRTGGTVKGGGVRKDYEGLVEAWAVHPKLAELVGDRLA